MLEFTFKSLWHVDWIMKISLNGEKKGGEAFEEATHAYRNSVDANYYPGKPGVTIITRGV